MRILSEILRRGPISRAEIAECLECARSTVSVIVNQLLEQGLIEEIGERQTGEVGRNPTLLKVNSGAKWILCIDLDIGETTFAICDLAGAVGDVYVESNGKMTTEGTAQFIVEGAEHFLQEKEIGWEHLVGVGVVVPGSVRHDQGTVQSLVLGWKDPVRLQAELKRRLPVPVLVENDVKAAAFAEWKRLGQPTDLFYVYIGRGIGGAYIKDHRVHHGCHYMAGQIGHATVDFDGPACSCGRRGCLECFASVPSLLAAVHGEVALNWARSYYPSSLINLAKRFESGDSQVVSVVERAGAALGATLSNMIRMVDCASIIIGGPIALLGSGFLVEVEAAVKNGAPVENIPLHYSDLDEDGKAVGMANLFTEVLLLNTDRFDMPTASTYFEAIGATDPLRALGLDVEQGEGKERLARR